MGAMYRRRAKAASARRQPGHAQSAAQDPRVQAQHAQRDPYGREYQTPQRIDPGYIWGNRRYY